MAKKALEQSVADAIIADWRTGVYSQQKLAERHGVSKGVVNKLCKGITQDCAGIVTDGVKYNQGLAVHCDQQKQSIVTAVNDISKNIEFFTNASMKNAKLVEDKLNDKTSIAEHKMAQETLNLAMKGAGVVSYYPAGTTINNTNAQQNNNGEDNVRDEIIKRVLAGDE